jgi:hypothetical protein
MITTQRPELEQPLPAGQTADSFLPQPPEAAYLTTATLRRSRVWPPDS